MRQTTQFSKFETLFPVSGDDLRKIASSLADRFGWSILPTKGKQPHVRRWAQYQTAAPTAKELADMFAVPGSTGLCVIAGQASDSLVVRDYDEPSAYHAWKQDHADLAAELPTVRTARGFHVLCRCLEFKRIVNLDDGELRGKGVSVLPESLHPSGIRYSWINTPGKEIPLIEDVNSAGLLSGHIQAQCHELRGVLRRGECPASVDEAVALTLPTGPGQRNNRLFELALALKCVCPNASGAQLRMILMDWHRQALPYIRTKPFNVSLEEFTKAWLNVKSTPLSMQPILVEADSIPTPPEAMHYRPEVQRLVRTCAALQRYWKDRPFFLSVRKAAEIMGDVSKNEAWKTFLSLRFDGIIHLVETGTIKGHRASQWRYLLPTQ